MVGSGFAQLTTSKASSFFMAYPLVRRYAGRRRVARCGNLPQYLAHLFELFAQAATDLISGCRTSPRAMLLARLTQDFKHRPGLTRFLPAKIECGEVSPVSWKGSNDIVSFCRANGFLVADAKREAWTAGEMIQVFLK